MRTHESGSVSVSIVGKAVYVEQLCLQSTGCGFAFSSLAKEAKDLVQPGGNIRLATAGSRSASHNLSCGSFDVYRARAETI